MADVRIVVDGSVWGFTPLNEDAKHFFRVALETESWQWLGNALVVDYRPALELRQLLIDEGFSLQ